MLKCPHCGYKKTKVMSDDYKYNQVHMDYKRYRKCLSCGKTFATHEYWIKEPFKFAIEQRRNK